MRALDEHGEVMHRRRIDERHLPHADDTNGVFLAGDVTHDVVETVCYTEEIRAVDLIHLHALRNRQVLEIQIALCIFVRVDLVMQRTDMGLLVGTHQEEHHRQ